MPVSDLLPPDVAAAPPDRRRRVVFLLSPASASGVRASMVLRAGASFPLARAVQSGEGASLADVFTFTSGLYFRGKRFYAEAFARAPSGEPGALIITPGRGLVPLEERVTEADLREFAEVPIDPDDARYRRPLERDVRAVARTVGSGTRVVLLGSVASPKYTSILLAALDARLCFPAAFVGRGDMSRGGLLLRCVRAGLELEYASVAGARLTGARPSRLERATRQTEPAPDSLSSTPPGAPATRNPRS